MHPRNLLLLLLLAAAPAAAPAQRSSDAPRPAAPNPAVLARIEEARKAWEEGSFESSWRICSDLGAALDPQLVTLPPPFAVWILRRAADSEDAARADAIAQILLPHFDRATDLDPQLRASAQIAYADLAMARQEFPKARARYANIAANKDFAGTPARDEAELRMAEVDRLTRQYESATALLERLLESPVRETRTQAFYQLARLHFDREEFGDASKQLEQVFLLNPDHPPARILEGQIHLKTRKLLEATEVKVGLSSDQKVLVPGRPFKIKLEDRNLAVVGRAENIEIRVTTTSGDEETLSLLPFGDSRTVFEATLPTTLGAPSKGDLTLQINGADEILYGFSPAFKKARGVDDSPDVRLIVSSDGNLLASSGDILTPEQIAELQLEQDIRDRTGLAKESASDAIPLSDIRAANQIKPGNRINLRVIDPDADRSAGPDTLPVTALGSSGDILRGHPLTETGPHTGVFEGTIQTASAPAAAFASSSAEGTNPNAPISSGGHPAWVAGKEEGKLRVYSVDLKDNIQPGTLVLKPAPGREPSALILQTSLNGSTFETLAAWPEALEPWDGEPLLTIARWPGKKAAPKKGEELRSFFVSDPAFHETPRRRLPVSAWPKTAALDLTLKRRKDNPFNNVARELGIDNRDLYVAHLAAAFHSADKRNRSITLRGNFPDKATPPLLLVDGEPAQKLADGSWQLRRPLGSGVHRLDVYFLAEAGATRDLSLHWDTPEAPFEEAIPLAALSPKNHPEIAAAAAKPGATIEKRPDGSLQFTFPEPVPTRMIRLLLTEYAGDAPGIAAIELTGRGGNKLLPSSLDLLRLRENRTLEIVPGDRITIRYDEDRAVTPGTGRHEAFLTATYSNARIAAALQEVLEEKDGKRDISYIPIRRFRTGEKVSVIITDPDADTSDKEDSIPFEVVTPKGKRIASTAIETAPHSGVFAGGFFPVPNPPQRDAEIEVAEGEDLAIRYTDVENTDPGVPYPREVRVEQSFYADPQFRLLATRSREVTPAERQAALERAAEEPVAGEELYPPTRVIEASRPAEAPLVGQVADAVAGGPLMIEILHPTIALSPRSTATLFVQAESARRRLGDSPPAEPFDKTVPGTIGITTPPSALASPEPPEGVLRVVTSTDSKAQTPLDDGRFSFVIPIRYGQPADRSLVDDPPDPVTGETPSLILEGSDTVHVGFEYQDASGTSRWATGSFRIVPAPILQVMDRKYQEELDGAPVGETLFLRLIDRTRPASPPKVSLALDGKPARELTLTETLPYSGIYKASVELRHERETTPASGDSVAVTYGSSLGATYAHPDGATATCELAIYKGSDGTVLPFTKRFRDPELAVQTQFTLTEAHFEMAKKHRELKNDSLAWEEITRGKKVLGEALRDFPGSSQQAQADYLLANLELELGDLAEESPAKRKHHLAAVRSFSDLIGNHPESPYAPKAQFKKAVTFEKMGEIDRACEEYVKLSYRYPENELVPETIARLGHYFFVRGKTMMDEANKLTDTMEREKALARCRETFTTAAEVFGRLGERFPNHQLADRTSVLSAQCYLRAENHAKAAETFQRVTENPNADKDARPEAMFWCGEAYLKMADGPKSSAAEDPLLLAYRMYKRLTWDYPESKWAKYARGRLTEGPMAKIAAKDDAS